jgi:putative SOS response-associated peptidase YedK
MCGRYGLLADTQAIAVAFKAALGEGTEAFEARPSYNIAPQTFQPVIRLNEETGKRELMMMRWGLVPFWSKDAKISYITINAKAETVATSPAFREAWKRRRLLVPAEWFYEWEKSDAKTKQPYAISLKDGSLSPLLACGISGRTRPPASRW